ncbi:MAG: hypothetical protein ABJF89_10000 [Parasphingorhabdus sp.]|uniref:hypothetical protein n=1 Tax=Parasphingorhabdus sp. TaxID=2709688 RepID=UPI003263F941
MLRWIIGLTKPVRYKVEDMLYRRSSEKEHLAGLKDKYKGKPLLIVGNGPSINKTPLERFNAIASIGMNKIDMLFDRSTWRPSLIMCTNNLVVKQHSEGFSASEIPIYLAWKSRWFLKKRSPSIRFFNLRNDEEFSGDVSMGMGSGATVTYAALQLAYHMGANPVIIVGVDHSFDKSGSANIYEKRSGADNNHFDPNYFKDGSYWGVPNLDASEEVFLKSRVAFEQDGRKVYDATIDGKLQIFEKIGIDEAVALVDS